MLEAANLNPTTQDSIKRYGGTTSAKIAWPDEAEAIIPEAEKWDRIEAKLKSTMETCSRQVEKKLKAKKRKLKTVNVHTSLMFTDFPDEEEDESMDSDDIVQ